MIRLICSLLVLVTVGIFAAEPEVCYQYRRTTSDPWTSAAGADAQILAWCYNDAGSSYNCSSSGLNKSSQSCTFSINTSIGDDTSSPYNAVLNRHCVTIPTGTVVSTGLVTVSGLRREDPDGCPPDPCAEKSGQSAYMGMSAPLGAACLGGCSVNVTAAKSVVSCTAGGACSDKVLAQSSYTGASCTDEPAAQQGSCITGSFGRVCIKENNSNNCGIFNGDRVCVESISSGCQSYASGGMACVVEGEGATEDLPDDGEGGPAQPQMQVEKEGKVVNYYNSSTVSNSSVVVVGNEASGGNGGVGSGTGGLGDGEAIEECEGETDCYGTLPDEVTSCSGDSFVECVSGYAATAWDVVTEGVPILGLAAGLHSSFETVGSCPEVPVTIFEETHDAMAPVCSILSAHGGLFQLIMQICWSILGIRILLKPEGEGS